MILAATVCRRLIATRIEENVSYPLMDSSIRMHPFETIRSSCRYVDGRRLWLGKATLTATAVKITGWRGLRRYVRRVLLDDLQSVSRRAETAHSNISFRLTNGSTWSANVSAPGLWRIETAQRIRAIHPDRAGDGDEAVMNVSTWPPVVEAPVVEAPVDKSAAAEATVAEASAASTPTILSADPEALPDDPVEPSYSLNEAYVAAEIGRTPDLEAPTSELDAGQPASASIPGPEPAPTWRPIRFIASEEHPPSGREPIDDPESLRGDRK